MNEALAAVLGALVGSWVTFRFDIKKERAARERLAAAETERRQQRRREIATALLADCRVLENVMRKVTKNPTPSTWRGQSPAQMYDAVRSELILMEPRNLVAVLEFFGFVRDFYVVLGHVTTKPAAEVTDYDNWALRLKARFALHALGPAADALVAEGGMAPLTPAPRVIFPPELPELPKPRLVGDYDE